MRDNFDYHAANNRAQAAASDPFCGLRRAENPSPETGCPSPAPTGTSGSAARPRQEPRPRRHDEWTVSWYGLASNPLESIASQSIPFHSLAQVWGKGQGTRGLFITMPPEQSDHLEVRTMASCVACEAELEPPVRVPHTVYVKSLYRIAGQEYCRHPIIRAAVAAGVITEVMADAGPVVTVSRD